MYSIAKQRKGSEVDLSAVSAYTVCACSSCSCHCFLRLVSNQMQKYKKSVQCVKSLFKKMQLSQMSTRRIVLKSLSVAVCGGTVKKQIARSEHVWSSDVHTFTTRQSFHQSLYKARASVTHRFISVINLPHEM